MKNSDRVRMLPEYADSDGNNRGHIFDLALSSLLYAHASVMRTLSILFKIIKSEFILSVAGAQALRARGKEYMKEVVCVF